jgi:DNA-binding NarL/FixJ family response regulator
VTPQNLTPLSAPPTDLTALGGRIDGSDVVVFSFPYAAPVALDVLTPAEREVITAVLHGRSNADVARERGTSARTVAVQLSKAFRKLRVRGRGELAAAVSGRPF